MTLSASERSKALGDALSLVACTDQGLDFGAGAGWIWSLPSGPVAPVAPLAPLIQGSDGGQP